MFLPKVDHLHPEVLLDSSKNLKPFLGLIGLTLVFSYLGYFTFFFLPGRLIFFYTINDKKKYSDREVHGAHGDRSARSSMLSWLNARIQVANLEPSEIGLRMASPVKGIVPFFNVIFSGPAHNLKVGVANAILFQRLMQALLPTVQHSKGDRDVGKEGVERRILQVMTTAEKEMGIPHLFDPGLFSEGNLDELVSYQLMQNLFCFLTPFFFSRRL